jgi:hypothetical protein
VKLIVETGNLAGREFTPGHPVVSIGRGADNDIVLREHGVSRKHARLQHSPQGWLLTDLGSTNGTYINRQRIREHEPYVLRSGDQVAMGSAVLAVWQDEEVFGEGGQALPATGPPTRRRPHPAIMIVGALCVIVVLVGIVLLLVTLLQPAELPATPTVVEPLERMRTALPIPTGIQDIVTAVVTLIPPGLQLPRLRGTPTPTPEAAVPGQELVGGQPSPAAPVLAGREGFP